MKPNIAMNFADYVVWILLCKHCKFGEKNYYHARDIEFFLRVPFLLARPVESLTSAFGEFLWDRL